MVWLKKQHLATFIKKANFQSFNSLHVIVDMTFII